MATKPAVTYTHDANGTNSIAPTAGLQSDGYADGAIPTAQELNGLLGNITEHCQYLADGALEGNHSITGNLTVTDTLAASGPVVHGGVYRGDIDSGADDLAVGDVAVAFVDSTAAASPAILTGMAGGGADGRMIELWNVSASNQINLSHESASSSAANRFLCPGGAALSLALGERAIARYDSSVSRWRVSK